MNATDVQVAIAIDPGRAKCGVAVVEASGAVQHQCVVPTETLCAELAARLKQFPVVAAIVVGCGTGCKELIARIADAASPIPVEQVDEAHTSEEARRRWVQTHPPSGLGRLMPSSLRCPDAPYDDYVAIILAERWWRQRSSHSLQTETLSA
jgi:RNase H-fold protein (predicted Holliday junction resolvase)